MGGLKGGGVAALLDLERELVLVRLEQPVFGTTSTAGVEMALAGLESPVFEGGSSGLWIDASTAASTTGGAAATIWWMEESGTTGGRAFVVDGTTGAIGTSAIITQTLDCTSIKHPTAEELAAFKKREARGAARSVLKSNITILVRNRQSTLAAKVSAQEQKARDTLRDMISEREYRRYLANGFLMVRSASGRWYQVFTNQRHIRVYEKGALVSEICIHTARECPPTDHVIQMKILAETAEELIWDGGNVRKGFERTPAALYHTPESRLLDVYNARMA
jgi:hypothetical protein